MKYIFAVLILEIFVFQSSENSRELEYQNIYFINGRAFAKADTIPFTGRILKYYLDRKKETEATFKNGLPNGMEYEWYENGQLKSAIYRDSLGREQSKYIAYYENGKISVTGQYKDGDHTGNWYFYDINGKVTDKKKYTKTQ